MLIECVPIFYAGNIKPNGELPRQLEGVPGTHRRLLESSLPYLIAEVHTRMNYIVRDKTALLNDILEPHQDVSCLKSFVVVISE